MRRRNPEETRRKLMGAPVASLFERGYGGLSTVEEKSIGAYTKSGTKPIVGLLKPGIRPGRPGLYLMDMIPDGPVRWGYPNINDTTEVVEMIAVDVGRRAVDREE